MLRFSGKHIAGDQQEGNVILEQDRKAWQSLGVRWPRRERRSDGHRWHVTGIGWNIEQDAKHQEHALPARAIRGHT
jgi:hypothetical protein